MNRLAIKMLVGDGAKFFALVFAIASCAFLIAQQVAIFTGLMDRTTSQIKDVREAPIWVMDPGVRYIDEIKAMPASALSRVRSVEGVAWAVPFYKGYGRATAVRTEGSGALATDGSGGAATSAGGEFRQAILLGVDDATLIGLPRWMLLGDATALREPDAVIIDDRGYASLFPGEEVRLGRVIELNDRRAVIVGVCRVSPPFQTFPVLYARLSTALSFVGRERTTTSFVLAHPAPGVSVAEACRRIEAATGLKAVSGRTFARETILYYVRNTGIPVNFGITIAVAVVVGVVISGQTLYLFVIENSRVFASLKAVGLSNGRLARMVVLQAAVVGVLGLGVGIGAASFFFYATNEIPHLRNFELHGEIAAGTAVVVGAITLLAGLVAMRRVLLLEPGIVFKG
jgi:putative ABC transport system permease protein